MINFKQFNVLTFDCYGTLIDWESGILTALRPLLKKYEVSPTDNEILDLYAQLESEAEARKFQNYKAILRQVVQGMGEEFGFTPQEDELNSLAKAIPRWKPFPDTVPALRFLKKHFKLAIISNIDNDLITSSLKHLKVKFDAIITAEQVKSYKPSRENFLFALKTLRQPKQKVLHVAQSIFHDIVPAKQLGLSTVWVNRRKNLEGFGATPPAYAQPDLEVPDLRSLVTLMEQQLGG
ncbi:MAG: haloacid dehalogenase type II [Calditrichaeota bacterium]|nr:MAG: haloacid dehalogenase type II [Calditrichota bacterium]